MIKDIYAVSYKMKQELYHKVFIVVAAVFICFVSVSLFLTFAFFPVRSVSSAMEPDIPADSIVMVTALPFLRSPHRGDVVLLQGRNAVEQPLRVRVLNTIGRFVTAQQWQPIVPESLSGSQQSFRRIVGMPGDTIQLNNYVMYITPKDETLPLSEFELTESKYNVNTTPPPKAWDFEMGAKGQSQAFVLGPGEYFVLGDNRLECADSRLWGIIRKDDICGKALLLYFPFSKFRVF